MKTVDRKDISVIKMATNPPQSIIDAGFRVINTNGFIYEYVGLGWIKCEKAEQKDYLEIPQIFE
jgi:hypothetical protein